MLSACSSATLTRLAYNNAAMAYSNLGPMLTWMVDDYVDLDGAREDWVRVRIDRVLAWHRAEELPRYRALLETMLAKSERRLPRRGHRRPPARAARAPTTGVMGR